MPHTVKSKDADTEGALGTVGKASLLAIILGSCSWTLALNAAATDSVPHSSLLLVFSDECDSDAVASEWQYENGVDSRPYMLSSRWRQNVERADGVCKIWNRKERKGGKEWTSGHYWSNRLFLYGYFEARLKYAVAPGINNAFWLLGRLERNSSVVDCEIDIVEGWYPNIVTNNLHHYAQRDEAFPEVRPYADKDFSRDFHVFALEWTPTDIRWFVDGTLIRQRQNEHCHSPLRLRFSSAVIRDFAGAVTDLINGTAMEIDYVRVYGRP
jgi:beta-glucanase (GH16 family)